VRPRSRIAALVTAAIATAAVATGCGGSSPQLVSIGAGLRGPSGLRATVYATGLSKAAAFAFDSRGRLWVATADYTDKGHDGVYLVASRGAKPTEIVTGLHTPLGLLWYHDSLYVTSTGRIDAYSELRGDRFTRRRTILALPAHVGESNNIVLAPNGRMLMGISASCDHCTPASKLSGAIVSFRPDGRDLRVYAAGIRAPVGLAFYPGTHDLFVTMNQRDDLGARTPGDWLAVVNEGEAWGFPRCYGQSGAVCHGVPQPVAVLDQHAAAGDVAIVTGELGSKVGTAALVAEWAKGTVLRVTLHRSGSHSRGTAAPFLTGVRNPVALIVTGDHALLVGDWATGTIYRIAAG
jgi:glucose/arabinose dehydrogenase